MTYMNNRKILITGADGLLGSELKRFSFNGFDTYFFSRRDLDITNDKLLATKFEEIKPDFFINTAAFTNVDRAETDKEKAFQVNASSLKTISNLCLKYNTTLIHISTDYVFTGNSSNYIFTEDSVVEPVNYYGYTKAEGEKIIVSDMSSYFILRTSWLYGGDNIKAGFVNKFLEWSKINQELKIVVDEVSSPTYVKDLAIRILSMIYNFENYASGIYHCSNEGICSRYELACEIKKLLLLKNSIIEAKLEDFNRPAKISNMLQLKNSKSDVFRNWKDALTDYLLEK
jgi:dTDP-4-dehydrorhamnose reductase